MYSKCSWEKEIELDILDKRRSIEWIFKSEESDINKSVEGDNLSAVETKLGSEIKPVLEKLKRSKAEKLVICKAGADSIADRIAEEPLEESVFDKSLNVKIYSYSQMYKKDTIEKSQGGVNDMRVYNNKIASYASLHKELGTLTSIIDGIQDDKEYRLTEDLVKELGL
jgi:hypothetical protein